MTLLEIQEDQLEINKQEEIQIQITNYKYKYKLQIRNYKLQITNYKYIPTFVLVIPTILKIPISKVLLSTETINKEYTNKEDKRNINKIIIFKINLRNRAKKANPPSSVKTGVELAYFKEERK